MIDPITFSIIRHRLFRVVDEAVITLKNVSGSAITNEGHDLMVSLYRADGTLLMGGVGFLHHLTSAAEACKSIIRRFRGDIHAGDVFLLNDPYTAALHTSDVYLVAPIHYRGELVAWSACFVHVYDIGATNPGGFCPDAENIYTEGFSSPGIRLVGKGEINRAVMDTFLNMVRSPDMVALDLNSMIACNNVARERMLALIEKYGFETVDETCKTLIARSEEKLRARLRELPDGQWQSRQYLSVKDEIYRVELTMTKRDDSLIFDFSGSSEQSRYAINCTRWASLGGLFAPLFPLLCYDITWNEGVISPITMIAPEGTIVNCTRPAPVSVATVGAIQSVNNAACTTIGKLLSASEKYAPEASAVWHANHFAVFLFGQNQHNKLAIGILTETFAGAGGARAWADGIEVGGEIPNPISRMANVETVEYTFPIRYLYRRRLKDSGGPGRYRGGVGMELSFVPHDAPDGGMHYVVSGKGSKFPMSEGLAGGYPGSPNAYIWVKNNRAKEDAIPGEQQEVDWGVFPLMGKDALYVRWNGGGGYGDPLSRPPQDVARDIRDGLTSPEFAESVYGVIIDTGTGEAEPSLTEKKRTELVAQRKNGGQSAPVAGAPVTCKHCGQSLGGTDGNWKESASVQETPMQNLGGPYSSGGDVLLRSFSCPGCGILVDTETAMQGDPYLNDRLLIRR
ncbi:MAG: hydantoinase B/oxoprolinase family protein [Gammaproteobacteria bacterium]|nr:hydantoinase B/oxoprolinase family protein [Gammaproteobacteria bacterium]